MNEKTQHVLHHKNLQLKFLGQENEDLKTRLAGVQDALRANKEIMGAMLADQPDQSGVIAALKNHNDLIDKQNAALSKRAEELVAQ